MIDLWDRLVARRVWELLAEFGAVDSLDGSEYRRAVRDEEEVDRLAAIGWDLAEDLAFIKGSARRKAQGL